MCALPRQSLHEAAGYRRDDDDAHKQGGGDSDNQWDEEEVSNWGKRKSSKKHAVMSIDFEEETQLDGLKLSQMSVFIFIFA